MTSRVISDLPTIADALDRLWVVRGIANQIATCDAPQTFGVHGDWGSGKTSLLRQMRYHLSGETEGAIGTPPAALEAGKYKATLVTIWFEAWRYQNEPVPVVALLGEMRRQFGLMAQIKSKGKKLASVSFRSLLNTLGEVSGKLIGAEGSPIHPDKIEAVGERWEREHLEEALFSDSVHGFLREAISELLKELKIKSARARVVVFIDDLDRCSPECAYRLLEGLRIYLALENCVFVLGMNQQVVIDAIAMNLSKGEVGLGTRNRAEAYLEKLCTNIWRLPLVQDPCDILAKWIDEAPLALRIRTDIAIDASAPSDRRRFALPPNPRRLKAVANLLLRYFAIMPTAMRAELDKAPMSGAASLMQRLVIVAYIYQFHGDLFQRWQNEPDFFLTIREWVGGQLGKSRTLSDGRIVIDLPDHFGRLQLPGLATTDPNAPTPQTVFQSTHPDPTAPEVFWIGRLIGELGSRLRPEDFLPLLRLVPAP